LAADEQRFEEERKKLRPHANADLLQTKEIQNKSSIEKDLEIRLIFPQVSSHSPGVTKKYNFPRGKEKSQCTI